MNRALLFLLLVLGGCDAPSSHVQPVAATDGTRIAIAFTETSPGREEEKHWIRIAASPGAAWATVGPFVGRPVGIAPDGDGWRLFLEDGTVVGHAPGGVEETVLQRSRVRRKLAAALAGGGIWAAEAGESAILLLRLDASGWIEAAPPLASLGRPRNVRLALLDDRPVLLWREEVGGRREPGLRLARFTGNGWEELPAPPTRARDAFAALGGSDGLLVFEEETDRFGSPSRLRLHRLTAGVWTGLSAPAPEAGGSIERPLGLAAVAAGGLWLARADTAGLRLYRNLDASARAWSEAGALAEPAGGGGLSVLFLWVSLGLGLIVMLWSRRRMRELLPPGAGLPGPMPGALASPFDRGLAFLFDAALALPLPVAYRLAASDLDLFSPLPEGEAAMLYWVWIGGLSLLMIVGEWSGLGSVGKRILGLRVRSVSGGAPSAPQTLIRNLVRIVDFWPFRILGVSVPYLVALVSSTVSPRRQRLGDLFAGTVVRRHVPLSRREIVLASASPRRRDLLGGFGLRFRVEVPAVDEERLAAGLTAAQEIVLRLAVEKAAAVASRLRGFEVVIAADTVVALDDEILGKPKDRTEAVAMLAKLSGRTHRVLTGVAILDRATGQRLAHVETTEVDLRPLSAEEIAAYVDSGEADGKAGAYAIQETADRFVSELRGSFTNVVGLPTEAIAGMFEALDG